ncbi:hypothetical protein ENSA5_31350 [Enhygromyxa salina]|uniref:Calcineurin-like phosphoesterase domain-containing protein n=1 Tax=Enhygromyxa salina TaxID=215803 RepID=A0A2S9XYG7_9BACT|nr:hypothetical protein ENSA5_31350 [Enhygromyxa salina]
MLACGRQEPRPKPTEAEAPLQAQAPAAPTSEPEPPTPEPEPPTPEPSSTHFVSLSDIHFDPFLDPQLVPQLAAAEAPEWGPLLENGAAKDLGGHGRDTSYAVLKSALAAPASVGPWPPQFVIISGDFLAHSYRARYEAATGDKTDAGYHAFVDKTLQFLTAEISATFPKIPVFPALGNNDSYCGDYLLEPRGEFLTMLARAWSPMARGGPEFAQTFAAGGWYEAAHPGRADQRLIVLNTVFFSRNYRDACGADEPGAEPADPTGEQLAWLERRLEAARGANEKVSLIYHIPPGINVYSSLHSKAGACAQTSETFWRDDASTAFLQLVDQYHDIILASFAGHIHTDDFRLTYPGAEPGAASGFVHLTPAISPMFGNNPGFQTFELDAADGSIRDFTTYVLDLAQPAPSWRPEYEFRAAYGVERSYDLAALTRVREAIHADSEIRAKYIAFNPVDNPEAKQIGPNNWSAYWCGTGTMTTADFNRCYCDGAAIP